MQGSRNQPQGSADGFQYNAEKARGRAKTKKTKQILIELSFALGRGPFLVKYALIC